ncbi:MAG: branched-chain amino acid ABC transporter permease [Candidatus Bathyarchaeota archaeon]|nr:MAG: branched-chain amino acid ABC transporter permease [Candidatus Bathyarchaeota archaeon]
MVTTYIRRAYSSFVAHVFDIPARLLAFLLFLTLLFIPFAIQNTYYLRILILANVLAIFAVSWDFLVGRTGQISLGHAIFFGIGGYITALLSSSKFFGLPIFLTIPIAILAACIIALALGIPSLRVKGPYLALVTMSFPLILAALLKWYPLNHIFKGEFGIRGLPALVPRLDWMTIGQQRVGEYYVTLILLFAASVILYKIANSKIGLVFVSILDDELASKACGINVTKYKLMGFMISGLFGALAGCIQTHLLRFANPPMFALTLSFLPVIVTFLGGLGTIYGPIVGAYIYYILDSYVLRDWLPRFLKETVGVTLPPEFDFAKLLIFTLIVLILVIKLPRGIAKFTTDKLGDLEEARDLDERGPRIWKTYKKKEKTTSTGSEPTASS